MGWGGVGRIGMGIEYVMQHQHMCPMGQKTYCKVVFILYINFFYDNKYKRYCKSILLPLPT